eukprot:8163257-Pyramimonas_sp.AAC.1
MAWCLDQGCQPRARREDRAGLRALLQLGGARGSRACVFEGIADLVVRQPALEAGPMRRGAEGREGAPPE